MTYQKAEKHSICETQMTLLAQKMFCNAEKWKNQDFRLLDNPAGWLSTLRAAKSNKTAKTEGASGERFTS